jgi:hypothetical protein
VRQPSETSDGGGGGEMAWMSRARATAYDYEGLLGKVRERASGSSGSGILAFTS